ncbi:hypothetical protein RHMOL_Rhmol03G0017700 [Rhododendron molle]|uniref:Uncharacterized protein n=1 Tax=Rhododendron molle TaxID=49168 RepID=A0ACC0P949_RHOML|nr:hypothetical protein RHMOL_Rhmol03G0017700 [Rhododendron molle]
MPPAAACFSQITYLKIVCRQGFLLIGSILLQGEFIRYIRRLFCFLAPQEEKLFLCWNIAQLAKVKFMKKHGEWQDLHICRNIRSIVCLNLPSFSGGLNPWGTPSTKEKLNWELTPPFVDDGLLEIVGFKDAWHGLVLLCPNGHGTRLAQAHKIRFEFHKGAADHA